MSQPPFPTSLCDFNPLLLCFSGDFSGYFSVTCCHHLLPSAPGSISTTMDSRQKPHKRSYEALEQPPLCVCVLCDWLCFRRFCQPPVTTHGHPPPQATSPFHGLQPSSLCLPHLSSMIMQSELLNPSLILKFIELLGLV